MPLFNRSAHNRTNGRELVGFTILLFLFVLVFARYFYLQVLQHNYFTTASDNNRIKLQPIAPTRGYIYDRNGVLLVDNKVIFSAVLDREYKAQQAQYVAALQGIFNFDPAELANMQDARKNNGERLNAITLKADLSETELNRFAEVRYLYPGINIVTKMTRVYPHNELFAHVLGYVGRINDKDQQSINQDLYAGTDLIGKTGIEKQYEQALLGRPGFLSYEADAHGAIIRKLAEKPPTRGDDIYLTLDYGMQQVAAEAMAGKRGAVVAIDPATGEVLALVSTPSFNPNLFVKGIRSPDYNALNTSIDKPLLNRSVQGTYPPGSTIKPFAGMGGLHLKLIDWTYSISDPGFFSLPGDSHRFRDWKKTGHGQVNLDKAVYMSCDTYFYKLINKMGIDGYHDWMAQFGFGSKTGIDIPNEKAGLLPSTAWKLRVKQKKWIEGESMSVGIGQGYFNATPLQVALATAIVANKGYRVQPHLLLASQGSIPLPLFNKQASKIPYGGDPADWDLMNEAMRNVVRIGTAGNLRAGLTGYEIAGKTGTAQVVGIAQGKRYNESALNARHHDHAWFMGFAPADNPQVAVAVIVENGKHGSTGAGPIAKAVFDYVVHRRNTDPIKPVNAIPHTYEALDAIAKAQADVAAAELANQSANFAPLPIAPTQTATPTPVSPANLAAEDE